VVLGFETEEAMWNQKGIGTVISGLTVVALAACGGHPLPASAPSADEVNVGYGTQSATNVTGSIGTLEMEDLQRQQQSGRIEDLLQGRIAGLHVARTPNGGYTLRIRGTSSLSGNTEPLLVVDGMPVSAHMTSTTLSTLNPSDVSRVQVLKDAGSTAIYGSRGANGVILITTKRSH
jgi:TonB-dependent starch-binding outer membrane protein SusC